MQKMLVSYECKILNGKLVSDIKIVRYCPLLQTPLDIYQYRKQYQNSIQITREE